MKRIRGRIAIAVFLLLCAMMMPRLLGYWIYQEAQDRIDVTTAGKFSPALFSPSFTISDASFEWDNKVRLISGDLQVKYNPLSFLIGKPLRVQLKGDGLTARLLGDWAKQEGLEHLPLDYFYADLGLDRHGISEIYSIIVESPKFQFRFEESEGQAMSVPSGREAAA